MDEPCGTNRFRLKAPMCTDSVNSQIKGGGVAAASSGANPLAALGREGRRVLQEYEEAVGLLSKVSLEDGFTLARIGNLTVVLPPRMQETLQPLVGRRIALLRTDIPGKREYLGRVLEPKDGMI